MLWTPRNRFMWQASNYNGVGVHTPGNNVVGATTTQLLSSAAVANDVYCLVLYVYGISVSAAAKDALVNLRTDPAGGTAWTTVIANLGVSCSGRNLLSQFGSACYVFPLFVKAGSSIGFNGQINSATVGTMTGRLKVYGKPSRPELVSSGSYVTTFGANTATSAGTAITPGASFAEGAYVQLGAATTKSHWWWQAGFGINDGTIQARSYYADVAFGDATNKHNMIQRQRFGSTAAEELDNDLEGNACCEVPSSHNIYGRATSSGTAPDTNYSMIAYGLGG